VPVALHAVIYPETAVQKRSLGRKNCSPEPCPEARRILALETVGRIVLEDAAPAWSRGNLLLADAGARPWHPASVLAGSRPNDVRVRHGFCSESADKERLATAPEPQDNNIQER
jgi:hypothetical protein